MTDASEYEDCFGQIEPGIKAEIWTEAGICLVSSTWSRNPWCNLAAF